eukprot:3325097-Pleurochrysis_carterae.AAC.2
MALTPRAVRSRLKAESSCKHPIWRHAAFHGGILSCATRRSARSCCHSHHWSLGSCGRTARSACLTFSAMRAAMEVMSILLRSQLMMKLAVR